MKTTYHEVRTLDLVLTEGNTFFIKEGPKLKHVEPLGRRLADELGVGLVISDLTRDGKNPDEK